MCVYVPKLDHYLLEHDNDNGKENMKGSLTRNYVAWYDFGDHVCTLYIEVYRKLYTT